MSIKIRCRCGQVLTVKDELAGKQAKCPKCQAVLTLSPGNPQPTTVAGDLADLLEEEGIVTQEQSEHGCPECGAELLETSVICVNCGYSRLTGGKLKIQGLSKDEEKLHPTLRKAMKQVSHEKGEKVAEGGEGVTSWLVGLLLFGFALLVLLIAVYTSRLSGISELAEAKKQLKEQLGRDPTDKQLAEHLEITVEELKAGNIVDGPSGLKIAKGALLAITTTLVCVTWLWLLVIAFKEAVIHGVASLITAGLYQVYYVITRWEKCRPPFLIFIVCILLLFATMCI